VSGDALEAREFRLPQQQPNKALQLTSGGPLARASRAPSLSRRSQLNAGCSADQDALARGVSDSGAMVAQWEKPNHHEIQGTQGGTREAVMADVTEEDLLARAVADLGVRRTFRKDGLVIELALLAREPDWRPLDASWWRGKEVCIIGADLDGNFILRHCDGSIRHWRHREQADVIVAKSVREFVQHVGL